MKFIRQVFADFREGKNIGPYLLVFIAIPLATLNLFGILQPYVASVTLAILGLLLNDAIASKRQMNDLEELIDGLPKTDRALIESGLVTISPRRSNELLEKKSHNAKARIRIFQTWIPGMTPLPKGLIESAKRGVQIQILLLQPRSEIAKQRAIDLEWSVNKPFEAFEDLVWTLTRNDIRNLPNVEVRFFNSLPPFMIYSVDDWILFSIYWHPDGSSTGPNIEVDSEQGYFGGYITRTFDTVWESETTINLDKMEKELKGEERST